MNPSNNFSRNQNPSHNFSRKQNGNFQRSQGNPLQQVPNYQRGMQGRPQQGQRMNQGSFRMNRSNSRKRNMKSPKNNPLMRRI